DRVLVRHVLDRGKEHAGDLLGDPLRARFIRVTFDVTRMRGRLAPEQHVRRVQLGLGHAAADRLENLRLPEFRNEQTERVSRLDCAGYVGPGSGPALDQAPQLQLPEGAIHGEARGTELAPELRLAGQPLSPLVDTRDDAGFDGVVDLPVLGGVILPESHGSRVYRSPANSPAQQDPPPVAPDVPKR